MKRILQIALIVVILSACAAPAAPTQEPTRKPVDVIIEVPTSTTAPTDAPTYTPIPATFTLEPTKDSRRQVFPVGKVTGSGSETIILTDVLPKSISVTADANARLFLILSSGERIPLEKLMELSKETSVKAIEVVTPYAWMIDFNPTENETPTQTAIAVTRIVTKAPTNTLGPTRTTAPTRTRAPTQIPTLFLPTDTPAPVVIIEPTNPPAQACCKICKAGKACGDSCISKTKSCNVGPGCACNG
jgi:hypothetical protein